MNSHLGICTCKIKAECKMLIKLTQGVGGGFVRSFGDRYMPERKKERKGEGGGDR